MKRSKICHQKMIFEEEKRVKTEGFIQQWKGEETSERIMGVSPI